MTQRATFAAGCFWGVESEFRRILGVTATRVGYTGGRTDDPSYYDVCSDTTGHAEAVEVEFDPEQISYEQLLGAFWNKHNPTHRNRQGWDFGDQYRSVIFVHDEEQREAAERSKAELEVSKRYRRQIATVIEPTQTFHVAEDYHQQYLEKQGRASCTAALAAAV